MMGSSVRSNERAMPSLPSRIAFQKPDVVSGSFSEIAAAPYARRSGLVAQRHFQ
jgi:hypothetical protein